MTKVKGFELASLAQQVEHAAVNRRVVGSNPTGGARKRYCRHDIVAAILIMGFGPLAQLVEQSAHNRSVRGSSP